MDGITQVRVHVGVGLHGTVVTSVDAKRLGCTIKREGVGFLVDHKQKRIWIPDTNVIYADLEKDESATKSKKTT